MKSVYPIFERNRFFKNRFIRLIFSLFIPTAYKKEIIDCDVIFQNQLLGCWVPLIAKYLYKNCKPKKIIIFSRDLTNNEQQEVEEYVMDKYAPPVNLGQDFAVDYGFCDTTLISNNYYNSDNNVHLGKYGSFSYRAKMRNVGKEFSLISLFIGCSCYPQRALRVPRRARVGV